MKRACWPSGVQRRSSRRLSARSERMTRGISQRKLPLVLLAASIATTAGCKHEETRTPLPVPVETAAVQAISLGGGTRYSANIVPYSQVDLAFQSNGYIDSLYPVPSPS